MSKIQSTLEQTREATEIVQSGYGSSFPILLEWSREVFTSAVQTFFFANLLLEATIDLLKTLTFALSANKNAENTADLIFDWTKKFFLVFVIFFAAALGAVVNLASLTIALTITPFINILKAGFFTGMAIFFSNTLDESNAYEERAKKFARIGGLGALIAGSLATLILVPALQIPAAVTLAITATAMIVLPLIVKIIDTIKKYKIVEKIKNFFSPRHAEDMFEQKEKKVTIKNLLKNDNLGFDNQRFFSLEKKVKMYKPIRYEQQSYFKNITNYKYDTQEKLEDDIDNHIRVLDESITHTFFLDMLISQQSKRENKVEALKVLQNVLSQWDQLLRAPHYEQDAHYYIKLNDNEVISLTNKNRTLDLAGNREAVIKRLNTYLTQQYPGVFQSFSKYERGNTKTLMDRVCAWIRQSKTKEEMEAEAHQIQARIEQYERGRYSLSNRTQRLDFANQNTDASTRLLTEFLAGVRSDKQFKIPLPTMSDPNSYRRFKNAFMKESQMQDSFGAQGERAKIFDDICALLHSKQLAETRLQHGQSRVYSLAYKNRG